MGTSSYKKMPDGQITGSLNLRRVAAGDLVRARWNAPRRIGAGGTSYELAGAVPGAPGAGSGCAHLVQGAHSTPDPEWQIGKMFHQVFRSSTGCRPRLNGRENCPAAAGRESRLRLGVFAKNISPDRLPYPLISF